MRSAPAPDPTVMTAVAGSSTASQSMLPSPTGEDEIVSPNGKIGAEKNSSHSATQASNKSNEPSLSAADQAFLIAPSTDTPFDKDAGIAHGQSMTPSLSATDHEPSSSHDEMPTETTAELLHAGSDPIAVERLDQNNDGDDNTTTDSQAGKRGDDKNKDDEDEQSGGIGGTSPSQESQQHHGSMDTAEATTAIPQSLTRRLLASGGDIRALLSSDQPLSSLWAQSADTGNRKEGTGQKIDEKDEEEVEEEEQEERFVRPRRLRIKQSKGAASDGFPSAIALSLRWHPDHMQDAPNLSIRAAFDTKYDEYYVFRHWRPSQGSSPPNKIHSNYTFL